MFKKALFGNTQKNLALLGKSSLLKDAYLAGGTALALQLGHRASVDLDFFTLRDFTPKKFAKELSAIGRFYEEQASKGTVLGEFEGVKFSLFVYKYKLLYPFKKFLGINIADIRDIAAMKIDTISTRGYKRDFIDLYFICREFPLKDILKFYNRKYGKLASNIIHIQKSLVYFEDAEKENLPKMLKETDWKTVKSFFEKEVKKIVKKIIK